MNYSSSIDHENKLIIIETTGSLTYDVFPKIIQEIITISKETKYLKALVNHEKATVAPLTEYDLRKIAEDCTMMNEQLKGG